MTEDEIKELSKEELLAKIKALKKELLELMEAYQEKMMAGIGEDVKEAENGSGEILYGLPDAPRAHLLVFADGTSKILPDQAVATDWINDPVNEQPAEIWEMKKRTVIQRQKGR